MKSFSKDKGHGGHSEVSSKCPATAATVPWSVLLEVEKTKGKGSKFREVKGHSHGHGGHDDLTAAMAVNDVKDVTRESPGWLCEVNCALGSVQTGENSDALRQWYSRWQQQSQQRNVHAKASTVSSAFPLKATRQGLSTSDGHRGEVNRKHQ